jgi:hypothetical protein
MSAAYRYDSYDTSNIIQQYRDIVLNPGVATDAGPGRRPILDPMGVKSYG